MFTISKINVPKPRAYWPNIYLYFFLKSKNGKSKNEKSKNEKSKNEKSKNGKMSETNEVTRVVR